MKKILLMTIACVLLFSTSALAHTGLETSTPEQGSTITEKLDKITLTFLTKIEETSTFTLTSSSDETVEVDDITVSENVLTGNVKDTLENGKYKINWKIVGADGHPMEGVIDFVIDASEVSDEIEPTNEPIEVVETDKSNTEEMDNAVEAEEESSNSTVGIIIVLVIIIALAVWWMARRKKK